MNNISQKIALLESELALLEGQKSKKLRELKLSKKECVHEYLVGGITVPEDEIYFCLSCGRKVLRSSTDPKVAVDLKDFLTDEEYTSTSFGELFDGYYALAKHRLIERLTDSFPDDLIKSNLESELVGYLEDYRNKGRGR